VKIGWPRTSIGWWRLSFAVAAAALSLAVILQPPPWRVFAEAGEKMQVVDYLVAYSWIAALINIGVLGFLALICPWWSRAPRPVAAAGITLRGMTPRWFWPALLAGVVACACLAGPRMTQSLWDDEEASLRFAVLGRYKLQAPEGNIRFKEVRWRDTIFYYDTPNNHVFHNMLARLANSTWRLIARPEGLQFKEWALRIPAFLAGLGTLVVLALLLRDLGLPLAGVLSVWVLALHPWYVKYCAEARGYTLAMLLLYGGLLFWRRGMVSGRWIWWGSFAAAETLALWTWPGSLFFLVPLNAATLLLASASRSTALPRRTVLSRWFCVSALAAIALIQLMLPLFPQMKEYLAGMPEIDIGGRWAGDVTCYLATGAPWTKTEAVPPIHPEIRILSRQFPVAFWFAVASGAGLLAWGAGRLMRAGPLAATVLFTAIGALFLQVLQAKVESVHLYEWYVIYVLPAYAAVFAVGVGELFLTTKRWPGGRLLAPTLVLLVLAFFAVATQPTRAYHLTHSTTPHRESVAVTRPDPNPWSDENRHILTAGLTNPSYIYDPNIIVFKSPRDLLLLCHQADQAHRPLWLNLGHMWIVHESAPEIERIIDDPTLFSKKQRIYGEYPHCDRVLYLYVPGSVGRTDLTKYLSAEEIAYVRKNASIPPEKHFAQ